ncbi:MAG TPA: hypothetical protein PJ998_08155 [Terrimesophilobacter sp.]|nr:hypothetical protein [Terrimesophilobacter sp.]
MDLTDPSAASCLRMLLEAQADRLGMLARRITEVMSSDMAASPTEEWTGPARDAHDDVLHRLTAQLNLARSSLERAEAESRHAVSTLAGRV